MRPELQTAVDNLIRRGLRRGFVTEAEIPAEILLLAPDLYRPDDDFRDVMERVRAGGTEVVADSPGLPMREFNQGEEPVSGDPVQMYLNSIGRVPLLTVQQEVELAMAVAAGQRAARRLEEAEETEATGVRGRRERAELARTAERGRRASAHMVEANLRLVVKIARFAQRRWDNMTLLDLVQEGNLGLMRAVEGFDYRRGYRFSTYAVWWIKQAIFKSLDEQGRLLRLPGHVSEQAGWLHSSRVHLYQKLGRAPTLTELSLEMEMELSRVEQLAMVLAEGLSLDEFAEPDRAETEGTAATHASMLSDRGAASPVKPVTRRMLEEEMSLVLECLDDRQREVIVLRFGLADGHPRHLKEVARIMRVTPERIRQMEIRALEKLRQRSEGNEEFEAHLRDGDW